MNPIGRYERMVSRRPKICIVILIVATLFLSFFAAQMEMDSGENDFQPDTETARANQRISEQYGDQHSQITVITVADNVLSRQTLLRQLELEQQIRATGSVDSIITNTSDAPAGVSSPARLIAQAQFIARAAQSIPHDSGSMPSPSSTDGMTQQTALIHHARSLSPGDMQTILAGKNLSVRVPGMQPISLEFNPYEPGMISDFVTDAAVSRALPLDTILPFLLSNDYDSRSQTAGKSLMSISIQSDTGNGSLQAEKTVQRLAGDLETSATELRVLGDALVDEKVSEASGRNIALLMPIAFGFVIVVLALMYRSLTDTLLNLLSLVMAILWVYGLGVLLELNLGNPMMTTVPVLVIGLGIDYGIHYTSRYREELRNGKTVNSAVTRAGATVGLAILLTTITTVVGFLSNLASNIAAIRDFGILCSLGIGSAFILMLTFFPAAKTLIDRRRQKKDRELVTPENRDGKKRLSLGKKLWNKIGDPETFCPGHDKCPNNGLGLGAIAARTPVKVLVVLLLLTSVSVYGATQLEARYDFRDFLPEGLTVAGTFTMLVEDFNFSEETVYILVEGDVTQPAVFRKIQPVQTAAMNSSYAVDARAPQSPSQLALSMATRGLPTYNQSFADIWTANVDRDSNGEIDADITAANVTAVYNALMEYNREDASRVLNRDNDGYAGLLIRIPVDTENEGNVAGTRADMKTAAEPFKTTDVERVVVTGGPIVSYETFRSINEGQVQTLLITFLIALAILTMLYYYLKKGLLLGAVTIIPLVFVISWTFGTMYFLQIPLNPVTVTIAAITVGLGIDYSIHLTQRFLEDAQAMSKPECALCTAASHTGSALFGSATTTIVGFAILSFAIIPPLAQFGQVSAISILFAFLAAVFVLPTFLLLWYRARHD